MTTTTITELLQGANSHLFDSEGARYPDDDLATMTVWTPRVLRVGQHGGGPRLRAERDRGAVGAAHALCLGRLRAHAARGGDAGARVGGGRRRPDAGGGGVHVPPGGDAARAALADPGLRRSAGAGGGGGMPMLLCYEQSYVLSQG
jgi:hypothetical protein